MAAPTEALQQTAAAAAELIVSHQENMGATAKMTGKKSGTLGPTHLHKSSARATTTSSTRPIRLPLVETQM